MKTALTVLLSFVLLWTQGGSLSAAAPVDSLSLSATCPCHVKSCCYEAPTSAPQPAPATPQRAASQESIQAVVTLLVSQFVPVFASVSEISPAVISLAAPAVPLYQRNCAFLL